MATKQYFFYSTHTPFTWSSGPELRYFNDEHEYIQSLEEAEELARKHEKITYGEDHIDTAFGVLYMIVDN